MSSICIQDTAMGKDQINGMKRNPRMLKTAPPAQISMSTNRILVVSLLTNEHDLGLISGTTSDQAHIISITLPNQRNKHTQSEAGSNVAHEKHVFTYVNAIYPLNRTATKEVS